MSTSSGTERKKEMMKQYRAEKTSIRDADTGLEICRIVQNNSSLKLCQRIAKFAVEKLNQEKREKAAQRGFTDARRRRKPAALAVGGMRHLF